MYIALTALLASLVDAHSSQQLCTEGFAREPPKYEKYSARYFRLRLTGLSVQDRIQVEVCFALSIPTTTAKNTVSCLQLAALGCSHLSHMRGL